MSISSTTRTAGPFTGSGSTDTFPFAFKVFTSADLKVVQRNSSTLVETTLVLNSDYTVTLNDNQNSNPGGSVVLTAGALATGQELFITSSMDNLQALNLTNQGGFYPETINDALDKLCIQTQQQQTDIDRSVKISNFDDTGDLDQLVQDVTVLAADIDNIDAVAGNQTNIDTVAANETNINTVAGDIDNVYSVAAWINEGGSIASAITYDNTTSGLAAEEVQSAIDELSDEKQDKLVSGANIKTVGGTNLLGTGDVSDLGVGAGQTWQDVTGSRSLGVTYTNSTGRTIGVFVATEGVGAGTGIRVDDLEVGAVDLSGVDSAGMGVFTLVPDGSEYRAHDVGGTYKYWRELR